MAVRQPTPILNISDGVDFDDSPLLVGGDRAADADPAVYANRMQLYAKRVDGYLELFCRDDRETSEPARLTIRGESPVLPGLDTGAVPFGAADGTFDYDVTNLSFDDATNVLSTGGLILSGLTATRLLASNGSKTLASVGDLTTWVAGTSNQITVANDGDGSITISLPSAVTMTGTLAVTGHLTPVSSNAYDFGDATHVWRNGYFGTTLFVGVTSAVRSGNDILSVGKNQNDITAITVNNTTAGTGAYAEFLARSDSKALGMGITSSGFTPGSGFLANECYFQSSDGASINVMTSGAQSIRFKTVRVSRWQISSDGHILAETDNAYNFGASGATRVSNIYWGGQLLGPAGSFGAPSISLATDPNTGFYSYAGDILGFAGAGAASMTFSVGGFLELISTGAFCWSASSDPGGSADVLLYRDGAGILAQRNAAVSQEFRVYGTTTGPKYVAVSHDGTNAYIGGHGILFLGGGSFASVRNSVDLYPSSDNALDLGHTSLRYRSGIFGTSISVGSTPATSGEIRLLNNGAIRWRNAGNTANIGFGIDVTDVFQSGLGDVFPAGILLKTASSDVIFAPGNNLTTIQNGTAAQELRVYGTTTGPKYLKLNHDGSDAYVLANSGNLFLSAGAKYVDLNTSGHFYPDSDNAQDIGLSSNRWRSIYCGDAVNLSKAGVAMVFTNATTTTGANVGTLTNCPHTGNPTLYLEMSINGTTYAIPAFALS